MAVSKVTPRLYLYGPQSWKLISAGLNEGERPRDIFLISLSKMVRKTVAEKFPTDPREVGQKCDPQQLRVTLLRVRIGPE